MPVFSGVFGGFGWERMKGIGSDYLKMNFGEAPDLGRFFLFLEKMEAGVQTRSNAGARALNARIFRGFRHFAMMNEGIKPDMP